MGDAVERQHEDLADRVEDGHDGDIAVAAVDAEHPVAGDLRQAVGHRHDKSGQPQAGNAADQFPVGLHRREFEGEKGLFAGQEPKHPDRRNKLRNHRRQRRALYAHIKDKDKQWVKQDVQPGTDQNGRHAGAAEALGADEVVHAAADHDEKRPQQVDGQIGGRIGIGVVAGAKHIKNRLFENLAEDHQQNTGCDQHEKGIAHDPFGFVLVPFPACDRTERCAAAAEKTGKGVDDRDDRKGQPQPGQRQTG